MGNCISNGHRYLRCPKCGVVMDERALPTHPCNSAPKGNVMTPAKNNQGTPKNQKNLFIGFLKPDFPPQPNKFQPKLYNNQAKQFNTQQISIKVPINPQRTLFKWTQQNTVIYPLFIKKFTPDIIRHRTFQQKMLWFRLNMESLRVSWQNGCETLQVDRGNIIFSSLVNLQKKNLRKQLKIVFDDEKVDDAGGLLRQWMHLLIEQIFHEKTGIFQLCNTDETAYKFKWDNGLDEQYARPFITLLGIIIGKALFERISLNCYLNRSTWRQISGFTVFLHDAYSFDRDLYRSWKTVIQQPGSENLLLQFYEVKSHSNGTSEQIQLVKNGKNIQVDDTNKYQYIFQVIQLYCWKSVKAHTKVLMDGIKRVIPAQFLSVFEPYQFEMLLNGPHFINVSDWKANTIYKGYKHNDQNIVWFWQAVGKFDQKKLANLLHYCTGSNRVPILGFKYLQSNRNTVNKFTIQKVPLMKDNPFPRSYTCFNRLQLPEYKSYKQLEERLNVVVSQQITSFGLD